LSASVGGGSAERVADEGGQHEDSSARGQVDGVAGNDTFFGGAGIDTGWGDIGDPADVENLANCGAE